MRHCSSFRNETGVRNRRRLRPRSNGLQDGRALPRTMGSASNVRARRRQHQLPDRRRSNRFDPTRYERPRHESILSSKVKLGADASVAAGPKGRDRCADTDAWMRAEILSYSRSRGVFAGISLEGSTIRSDDDASEQVYGHAIKAKDIVRGEHTGVPETGRQLVNALRRARPTTNRNALRISSCGLPLCRNFLRRQGGSFEGVPR